MILQLKILATIEDLSNALSTEVGSRSLGFVPTMGALHEGHLRLISNSVSDNTFTICSIFINPIQFNNQDDFSNYPKTLKSDLEKLEISKCDYAFVPGVETIYPENFKPKHYELGSLENILEGAYRPNHFQGVCTVVHRFLDLINPTVMYLGRKDYQQCKVIQKMMQLVNLDSKIQLCLVETVRSNDGLALSSRNMRLGPLGKKKAVFLSQCLQTAKETISKNLGSNMDFSAIQTALISTLKNNGFDSVDYFEFVNENFVPIKTLSCAKSNLIVLTAATIESIRLIDNIEIKLYEHTN